MASWIHRLLDLLWCKSRWSEVVLRKDDYEHQNSPFLKDPLDDEKLDLERTAGGIHVTNSRFGGMRKEKGTVDERRGRAGGGGRGERLTIKVLISAELYMKALEHFSVPALAPFFCLFICLFTAYGTDPKTTVSFLIKHTRLKHELFFVLRSLRKMEPTNY